MKKTAFRIKLLGFERRSRCHQQLGQVGGNLQVGGTSMANVVMPFHLFYVLCLDNVVQVDINVYIFQYPNRESCNVPAKRHNMMAYGR